MFNILTLALLSVPTVMCSISIHRAGWLDRVVEYQKKRFIDDLMKHPSVNITVRLEKPPPGYVDSKYWDYESVLRLLALIRSSEGAAPVRRAFHRAVKTRRFWGFAESFKAFPSLIKDHPNDFHYVVDSGEYYADVPDQKILLESTDVIVVSNPVEAKLPSASISVDLLRTILENRAQVGRIMPTTDLGISWPLITKKVTSTTKATDADVSTSTQSSSAASVTSATGEDIVTTTEVPQTSVTTATSDNVPAADTTVQNELEETKTTL